MLWREEKFKFPLTAAAAAALGPRAVSGGRVAWSIEDGIEAS